MEKPSDNRYPIDDLLRRRWSPVAFADRPVPSDALCSLFEAARWAPSCFNEQPWQFIVAAKARPDEFNRLLGCLTEKNMAWAQRAPVLMLSVARMHFAHNGRPNRHAWHDVGLAAACLVIEATALGLSVHQMAGFNADKARDLYYIPEGYEPVAAFALGYPGDPDALPEGIRERQLAPRTRKPFESFVYGDVWGKPSPLWLNPAGDPPTPPDISKSNPDLA